MNRAKSIIFCNQEQDFDKIVTRRSPREIGRNVSHRFTDFEFVWKIHDVAICSFLRETGPDKWIFISEINNRVELSFISFSWRRIPTFRNQFSFESNCCLSHRDNSKENSYLRIWCQSALVRSFEKCALFLRSFHHATCNL